MSGILELNCKRQFRALVLLVGTSLVCEPFVVADTLANEKKVLNGELALVLPAEMHETSAGDWQTHATFEVRTDGELEAGVSIRETFAYPGPNIRSDILADLKNEGIRLGSSKVALVSSDSSVRTYCGRPDARFAYDVLPLVLVCYVAPKEGTLKVLSIFAAKRQSEWAAKAERTVRTVRSIASTRLGGSATLGIEELEMAMSVDTRWSFSSNSSKGMFYSVTKTGPLAKPLPVCRLEIDDPTPPPASGTKETVDVPGLSTKAQLIFDKDQKRLSSILQLGKAKAVLYIDCDNMQGADVDDLRAMVASLVWVHHPIGR